MKVRFWGVRGSIAVSGKSYLQTGGNTSCVEVSHEGHRLVLDGGTGLRELGGHLGFVPADVTLLFSHVHWDHIQGVPFFVPAFNPATRITVAGASRESGTIRSALAAQMKPPTFPITLDALAADVSFVDLKEGEPWEQGPFRITHVDLDHPDGVLAYRIEAGGRSVVYATDVEHGVGALDRRLVDLSTGANLLIHDAQYTRGEYIGAEGMARVGWGHSAWDQAVEVAELAAVERLALFHHDPMRNDVDVQRIEAEAQDRFSGTLAAREGFVLEV